MSTNFQIERDMKKKTEIQILEDTFYRICAAISPHNIRTYFDDC